MDKYFQSLALLIFQKTVMRDVSPSKEKPEQASN